MRAGKLEAATLERLSASEGMDRAMAALQAGVLTRREWRWGEKIRAVEVLSDLLTWIEGDYTFFRTPAREAGEFRLTIPRLVLELFLRSRDRGLVLHHLGGVDVPLVRGSRFDAEFSSFGLTGDAESVVRLIDGDSTAAEIASEAPADTFAVEKLLAALVTLGLVHPAYTAEEADSAAPDLSPAPAPIREEPEAVAPEAGVGDEKGEDELEPEVDIEERVAPAHADWPPPRVEEEPAGEPDREDLVDAPLDAAEAPAGADEEAERLATDFDGGPPIPGDLMEPGAPGGRGSSDFDRPLDLNTGVGSIERPTQRSTSPLLWVLVLLAAVVGGVLYWRARGPASSPEPMAGAASPSPTLAEETAVVGLAETPAPVADRSASVPTTLPASTAAPTKRVPTAAPTRPAPTVAPTRRATSPVPTRRAASPVPTRPRPGAGARPFPQGVARPVRARPEERRLGPQRAFRDSARAGVRGAVAHRSLGPRPSRRFDVGGHDVVRRPDVLPGPLGPLSDAGGRRGAPWRRCPRSSRPRATIPWSSRYADGLLSATLSCTSIDA